MQYPADKNIPYVYYLLLLIQYEQILDESKDLGPLIIKKNRRFLVNFPDTEYALDLKFKMDLINNQLVKKNFMLPNIILKLKNGFLHKWLKTI